MVQVTLDFRELRTRSRNSDDDLSRLAKPSFRKRSIRILQFWIKDAVTLNCFKDNDR